MSENLPNNLADLADKMDDWRNRTGYWLDAVGPLIRTLLAQQQPAPSGVAARGGEFRGLDSTGRPIYRSEPPVVTTTTDRTAPSASPGTVADISDADIENAAHRVAAAFTKDRGGRINSMLYEPAKRGARDGMLCLLGHLRGESTLPSASPAKVPKGWFIEINGEAMKVTKPDGSVSEWSSRPSTNGSGMYDLCMALAASPAKVGDAEVQALVSEIRDQFAFTPEAAFANAALKRLASFAQQPAKVGRYTCPRGGSCKGRDCPDCANFAQPAKVAEGVEAVAWSDACAAIHEAYQAGIARRGYSQIKFDLHDKIITTPHTQGAGVPYRLLISGDVIERGDEVMDDDTVTWCPTRGLEIGMRYSDVMMPIRRVVPTPSAEIAKQEDA